MLPNRLRPYGVARVPTRLSIARGLSRLIDHVADRTNQEPSCSVRYPSGSGWLGRLPDGFSELEPDPSRLRNVESRTDRLEKLGLTLYPGA